MADQPESTGKPKPNVILQFLINDWFLIVAPLLLVGGILLVALLPIPSNKGLKDATAALTIIVVVSVGIERVLEGFWTYIGIIINSWWPLDVFGQGINKLASKLNDAVDPFYQEVTQVVKTAYEAGTLADAGLAQANKDAADFKIKMNQLNTLAPGNQIAITIANDATQLVSQFQQKYPSLNELATTANQAINDFAGLIATPADNLGRRIISLFLGMYLGLIVASVLGLDLVQAIYPTPLAFHLGIIVTGLVIGLGSSPTHELIQILQNLKTNLKTSS